MSAYRSNWVTGHWVTGHWVTGHWVTGHWVLAEDLVDVRVFPRRPLGRALAAAVDGGTDRFREHAARPVEQEVRQHSGDKQRGRDEDEAAQPRQREQTGAPGEQRQPPRVVHEKGAYGGSGHEAEPNSSST
jgi:hypothetical protein